MTNQTAKHPCRTPSRVSAYCTGFGLLGLLLVGCLDFTPEPIPITYGSITDARDSQVYRTLSVKGVTWMQQDLNFQAPGSRCVDTASTCARRLYSWSTANGVDSQFDTTLLGANSEVRQGVCPEGWHLPTVLDWQELINIFDLPGITGDWTSSSGFDLKGWARSSDEWLGWYWIADESGPEKSRFTWFWIYYPMQGPRGNIVVEQKSPGQKKGKFGVRCLLDGSKPK